MLAILLAVIGAGTAAAADQRAPGAAFALEPQRDCGANGFALPGSAGCVHLSGAAGVTTTLRTGGSAFAAPARAAGLFATRVHGRFAADIRVPTDLGPLRIYTAIRVAEPGGPGHAP